MEAFREIACGLAVPEGPVALGDGSVLVVEVLGGRLTRVSADGTKTVVAETGGGPNGAAMGPDGKCYVCNNGGIPFVESEGEMVPDPDPAHWQPGSIQRVDMESGAVEVLYTESEHGLIGAPNDLVFDAHGGFWFTDHGRTWHGSRDRGGVYYAKADGSHIRFAIPGIESPNGIALSPDGNLLYVAETYTGHLWSFEVVAPGHVKCAQGLFTPGGVIVGRAGPGMFLDSMAVDAAGTICVGTLNVGGILSFSKDGQSCRHLPLPDQLVTNICFGGPDRRTAYVTLSESGRLVALDWPEPGLALHYHA